jgi:hypothetical protein
MFGNLSEFFEKNKKHIFIASIVLSLIVLVFIIYNYMKTKKELTSEQKIVEPPHEFCSRDGTCGVPSKDDVERIEKFVASKDSNDPEDDSVEPIENYTEADDQHGSDE